MQQSLTLSLLAALMLPSCSAISSARLELNEMTVSQYKLIQAKVMTITELASFNIAMNWDAARKAQAVSIIAEGRALLQDLPRLRELDTTDLVRALTDRYSERMGLDEETRSHIRNATLLMDVLVGPITIDIDGKLDIREVGLLLAVLEGLENGLTR